jgi:hypothetical protein
MVERLRVLTAVLADGWVTNVAKAQVTLETRHVVAVKYLNDEAIALLDVETVRKRRDASRVLAAVLDGQETLIDLRCHIHAVRTEDPDESTHRFDRPLMAASF